MKAQLAQSQHVKHNFGSITLRQISLEFFDWEWIASGHLGQTFTLQTIDV